MLPLLLGPGGGGGGTEGGEREGLRADSGEREEGSGGGAGKDVEVEAGSTCRTREGRELEQQRKTGVCKEGAACEVAEGGKGHERGRERTRGE